MPSGISHILVSRYLLNEFQKEGNTEIPQVLAAGMPFLTVGSVGPDLPYASIMDNDFFFADESKVADLFHYDKTNQIPLSAFDWMKQNFSGKPDEKLDSYFNFFLGYSSHIIADGVIHPFVRDMVGEYETNKSDHRSLEMGLDVLLYKHLTSQSGEYTELNYSNIHDQLKDILSIPFHREILQLFSSCIGDIYKKGIIEKGLSVDDVSVDKIAGWITGLHRLFSLAEGEHPKIYRVQDFTNPFFYKNAHDLESKKDKYLLLTNPNEWDLNFLKKDKIHFLEDCIPQYFKEMKKFTLKAYKYIYENGPTLTEKDLPAINLDHGRLIEFGTETITVNKETPEFWGAV